MASTFKGCIQRTLKRFGFEITKYHEELPSDITPDNLDKYKKFKPFTMTSVERVNLLIDAVKYIAKSNIGGAIVECGVWKGGSCMIIAEVLKELGTYDREFYLYDTFSGMTKPTEEDGEEPQQKFNETQTSEDSSTWCHASLEEVQKNIFSTGYPQNKFKFVKGKVEDTIPETTPEKIALLRLDTDWYSSTKHELEYLFPLLSPGGVLIIDDYGYWEGARKAVDEYFADKSCGLMVRIDSTGRVLVKTA